MDTSLRFQFVRICAIRDHKALVAKQSSFFQIYGVREVYDMWPIFPYANGLVLCVLRGWIADVYTERTLVGAQPKLR